MLNHRYARTGQWAIVYFISDLDPSGLDLQRAWEEALANFGVRVSEFVRIGLTREQVDDLDSARYVKASRSSPATVVLSAISSCMASAAGRQTFSRLPSSSRRSTITPAPGLTTAPPRSSAPAPCCRRCGTRCCPPRGRWCAVRTIPKGHLPASAYISPEPARLNGNTFPAVSLPSAAARRCEDHASSAERFSSAKSCL
jgi:hypothetical protein